MIDIMLSVEVYHKDRFRLVVQIKYKKNLSVAPLIFLKCALRKTATLKGSKIYTDFFEDFQ